MVIVSKEEITEDNKEKLLYSFIKEGYAKIESPFHLFMSYATYSFLIDYMLGKNKFVENVFSQIINKDDVRAIALEEVLGTPSKLNIEVALNKLKLPLEERLITYDTSKKGVIPDVFILSKDNKTLAIEIEVHYNKGRKNFGEQIQNKLDVYYNLFDQVIFIVNYANFYEINDSRIGHNVICLRFFQREVYDIIIKKYKLYKDTKSGFKRRKKKLLPYVTKKLYNGFNKYTLLSEIFMMLEPYIKVV